MATHIPPLLTNADLEHLPADDGNRYELIEGELCVSTSPDLLHQRAAGRIYVAFAKYLEEQPVGEILFGPGVILSDYDGVIPDLVYLSNERRDEVATGARIYGAPSLVVEILSPGRQNLERDRTKKLRLYAKFGVEEYWIVDPRERAVEVYRRESETLKLFATLIGRDAITSRLLPGFGPAVASFF
jgi:Uma2 family endonuclease